MVVLDCEDSVPVGEKERARTLANEAIEKGSWSAKEVGIRINGLDTEFWREDVQKAAASSVSFVLVPKVEEPRDVETVENAIRSAAAKKVPNMIVMTESPRGLVNLDKILTGSHLVTAVLFGAEDYSLSLGGGVLVRPEFSTLYAKSHVVAISRAFGIDALAPAFVNLNDPEGLRAAAIEAKNLGFAGKLVIHPAQIDIVNGAFSPTTDEVTWANEVLNACKEAESQGKSAFRVRDKMVDAVHVKIACDILQIAEQLRLPRQDRSQK